MIRQEVVDCIGKSVREKMGRRSHMEAVSAWVLEQPNQFSHLVEAFDTNITFLNDIHSRDVPSWYQNIQALKIALTWQHLPTIHSLISDIPDQTTTRNFNKTLSWVNDLMAKGETVKDPNALTFHTMNIDTEALLVGTMSHVYEEFVLAWRYPKMPRGIIECALIETLTLPHYENPLWNAISDSQRLNWVDKWPGFHPDFRASWGFR